MGNKSPSSTTFLNSKQWCSSFRTMKVSFNKNVWKLIPDSYDAEDSSLFGVIDNNDGASFSIDYALIEDDESFEYKHCHSEFFSRLFNIDNRIQELKRHGLRLGNIEFQCIFYLFENKLFGKQVMMRGIAIGDKEVIGINLAWPAETLSKNQEQVPPKLQLFLDEFELEKSE